VTKATVVRWQLGLMCVLFPQDQQCRVPVTRSGDCVMSVSSTRHVNQFYTKRPICLYVLSSSVLYPVTSGLCGVRSWPCDKL